MKLDLGSITFNMHITEGGGTPSWGTALGQNANYNYSVPGVEELLTSMVYCIVDTNNVFCPLGKGGKQQENSHYELASLYNKVYANGTYIPGAKFVLLIVKLINGDHHVGRRTLKYNPKIKYNDELINEDCYKKIASILGISDNGAWLVHSIHTKNQDELHFDVIIADHNNALQFQTSDERKRYILNLLKENGVESAPVNEDRKGKYKNWLTNLKNLGDTTITNYVRYIDYIKTKGFTEYDLYSVNDISILTDLINKFRTDELYINYNKENNRNPYNALSKYIEFMESERSSSVEKITGAYNMIYYGTPGCGKSFKVNKDFNKNDYIVYRTTFHPEYSNSDFVGQIIPKTENNEIKYEFQEGPFTLALCEAIKNPSKKVCLVIEEINRGNASAIFGDIFQLLDRENDGSSVYSINNEPVKNYLNKNNINIDKITIPSNLWIVATMNTSDQNVFTLDTAFKRRWRMHRIINEFNKSEAYDNKLATMYIPGSSYTWEDFITTINKEIMRKNPTGLNSEDKQLGVYFVTENELSIIPVNNDKEAMDKFIEKVLLYIWDDVAKLDPSLWFDDKINSFDDLVKSYYDNKLRIFKDMFTDQNNESQTRDINEEI